MRIEEVIHVYTKPENWEKLRDQEYRRALAVAQFKRFVPFQISVLRKQRQWSQQQLAEHAGLTQGVVSRAEDPDNGNLAVNTILRIANGLDCVFVGKFVSYSEFERWRRHLSEKMTVLGFEQEDAKFKHSANAPQLSPEEDRASKYLEEALTGRGEAGNVTYIDTRELEPVPLRQVAQLPLDLKNPADFDSGLRIVGKSYGSKVQNAPADNAKPLIAVGGSR